MDQVTLGLVGFTAIVAAWDSARRYFEVRRFNQAALDRQAHIEVEHNKLKEKVQGLSEKLSFSLGSNVSRMPRSGAQR